MPFDATVESAKLNPLIQKLMADKYDPLIAGLTKAIDEKSSEEEIAELLRKWKPTGPPN